MNVNSMTAEERSRRAKELLDDPFIEHVLGQLELKYVEAWRTSGLNDYDIREQAFTRLQALYEFRADLEVIATESAINAFNRRSREVI
jgi:hypothetical protein